VHALDILRTPTGAGDREFLGEGAFQLRHRGGVAAHLVVAKELRNFPTDRVQEDVRHQ